MSDPYAVLGLRPGATEGEVAVAYRELAKVHHPDRARDDGERMRVINSAYDEIVRAGRAVTATPPRSGPSTTTARTARTGTAPPPGAWLSPTVRRQLGRELLDSLQPHEDVLLVADASTWDSPSVRLIATDRRLLWLRDDAPVARVRFMSYAVLENVEARWSRRGRQAELRVKPREGRRLSFAAMAPEAVQALLRVVRPRLGVGSAPA
ncbi:MAG: hypothetical protein AVDCRST_MAG69-1162 [uncultured Solirubrobacteraceae bacterium]|uniref:J domain-containing protein n=1 Tax=uncultured Solirubrobacteraceae bacterium TaxID=1162706 RepID=A0A6J4SAU4_9ACTN|nr:MAG: hypothetical protein AVDCRST_MAG69-1162 [uncultured Solirubrobacteraceae bacterium]